MVDEKKEQLSWHVYFGERHRSLLEKIQQAVEEDRDIRGVSEWIRVAAEEKMERESLLPQIKQIVIEALAEYDLQPGQKVDVDRDAKDLLDELHRNIRSS